MVMAGNHSSRNYIRHCLACPDRLGWLQGPMHWKGLKDGVAFALDNDAFSAWYKIRPWDSAAWFAMLEKVDQSGRVPLWALIPDVVANRTATILNWRAYAGYAQQRGWKTAFAVQDGMEIEDVPRDADVVFVGGTMDWKWRTAPMWCDNFPHVHIGRIRESKLHRCEEMGAASCDGTGWFREGQTGKPARVLYAWLAGAPRTPRML
jgi:hypothetical protein